MAVTSQQEPPRAASQLGLLFRLKWTLTWRAYRRSASAVVGAILAILLLLPLSLGAAYLVGLGFSRLAPPWSEHLLRAVLLGIYLLWLLAPLMGYALNDSYDITRLFGYPISVRRIFTGMILGSLIDFTTLLLLPTLIAVVIGFGNSAAAFVPVAFAVALFLFHTLALSQALLLLSAGILRSRRFRDIALVVAPLFWMAYYVGTQALSRRAVAKVDWRRFLESDTWEILSYLPPGLAARGIAAAQQGEWGVSLAFLSALAIATAATVYLAGWLIQLTYAGEAVGIAARKPRAAAADVSSERIARQRGSFIRTLPPVVGAMADKEAKYLMRDPYFKVALMNIAYMLIVVAFAALRPWRGGSFGISESLLWWGLGLLLFSEANLLFNIFGNEGGASHVLFLFPAERRQMLLGKNLTLFGALLLVNTVFLLVLSAVAGALGKFALLWFAMALALVVLMAVGNIVSIRFPYRVVLKGWRTRQHSAGQGFAYGFLYLGVTAAAFGLLLPVFAAFVLPSFLIPRAWLALTLPLAAVYAAGLYALGLHLAAPLLVARELPVIEKLTQEEN